MRWARPWTTSALISLFTGKLLRPRLAMTGEMTLRGEVLPVGGVREKVVAARRSGINTVILPERNRADVDEIPETVSRQLTFIYARTYDDVLDNAFAMPNKRRRVASRRDPEDGSAKNLKRKGRGTVSTGGMPTPASSRH